MPTILPTITLQPNNPYGGAFLKSVIPTKNTTLMVTPPTISPTVSFRPSRTPSKGKFFSGRPTLSVLPNSSLTGHPNVDSITDTQPHISTESSKSTSYRLLVSVVAAAFVIFSILVFCLCLAKTRRGVSLESPPVLSDHEIGELRKVEANMRDQSQIPQSIIAIHDEINSTVSNITLPMNLITRADLGRGSDSVQRSNYLNSPLSHAPLGIWYEDAEEQSSIEDDDIESCYSDHKSKPQKSPLSTEVYDVYVPRGRLGLIIDTKSCGPVVHSIKPSSALIGILEKGDQILAVNDIDTTTMSVAALSQLFTMCRESTIKLTFRKVEARSKSSFLLR